jgi:hypothetical protein
VERLAGKIALVTGTSRGIGRAMSDKRPAWRSCYGQRLHDRPNDQCERRRVHELRLRMHAPINPAQDHLCRSMRASPPALLFSAISVGRNPLPYSVA